MIDLRLLLCATFLYCTFNVAIAQELSNFEKELLQTQMTTAKAILNLSPEQEAAFNEVLQSVAKHRQRTLQKYGISMGDEKKTTLNFSDKRALMDDMRKLKNNLEEQLKDVLTTEQISLFLDMQEDSQNAFKQRLRKKLN